MRRQQLFLAGALLVALAAPAQAAEPVTGNLEVALATPMGNGELADSQEAVEIAPDATVVVGGTMASDLGVTPIDLGGTTGAVTRLTGDGQVLSVSRVGAAVDDLDVDQSSGAIAVAGDAGVALLESDASQVRWSVDLGAGGGATGGPGRRVAIAGGTVAALYGRVVSVFGADGTARGRFEVGHEFVNDITVDPASGLTIVTGFDNDRLPGGLPVQVAFLEAYSAAGELAWSRYGWDGAQLAGNEADTRGMRVDFGADGLLYLAAEAAGGNHIFRSRPDDLTVPSGLVTTDEYQHAYNTASNHITYLGVLTPAGAHLRGTMLVVRLPPDKGRKGNTIRPLAITADEAGNVYAGGVSAYGIPGLDGFTFSGVPRPGTYTGGSWVAVLDPALSTRLLWTSHGAGSSTRGVAAGHGLAALSARVESPDSMVVVNPLAGQGSFAANAGEEVPDGYLSVWTGLTPGTGPPAPAPSPVPTPPVAPTSPTPDAVPSPPPAPAEPGAGSFLQHLLDALARLAEGLGEVLGNLFTFGNPTT